MKSKRCGAFIVAFVAALFISGSQFASAQLRIVGAISGTVTDPSNAAVPSAKIALKDEGTGISKETQSNADGGFLFPDLAFGNYEVKVTAAGFDVVIVNHISVGASQTTDVPVHMRVGQQTETVTVTGSAPVLETTSQLVTSTQDAATLAQLPSTSRSLLGFARLVPGGSPPNGGDTRFNNVPGGAVNVTVDGINDASNGFKSGGTVFYMTVPVREGALEEISVETGGLGADSGAQSGANIKFLTKRGGNQYHGSFFYQPQSEQFNANSWSNNANGVSRAYNRTHNLGGNFSGRLVPFGRLKDKLFFFVNYEYVYNPQVHVNTYNVATPAAQAGNYSYVVNGTTNQVASINVLNLAAAAGAPSTIDPVVGSILTANNKVPSYATRIASSSLNTTSWQWNTPNNLYQYYPTTRLDYYITPKEQLTVSWNLEHSWQTGYALLDGGNKVNPFRIGGYFTYSVALQSTISPTTLNEVRYGVQHSGDSNASATAGYGSYYTYNNTPLRIGATLPFGATTPYIDQQNTTGRHYITTVYDTFTKILSNHTITAGGSFRKTDWHDAGENYPIPTYALGTPSGDPLPSTLFTAASVPGDINSDLPGGPAGLYNELTGRVASARLGQYVDPQTKQYGSFLNTTWTRSYMGGLYVQDRWRLNRDLTINAGLRWEAQGDMYDVAGITAIPNYAAILGPSTGEFAPGVLSGNNNPTASVGVHPYPPDWLNFAPNVGLAWNPTVDSGILGKLMGGKKTVIRAYWGQTVYDEGTQFFAQNLGTNTGKFASQTLIPGQSVLPAFTTLSQIAGNPLSPSAFSGIPAYSPILNQAQQTFQAGFSGMNPQLKAPYVDNWSIGIQRELAKGTVLEVRYVGNTGHDIWRTSDLNEINVFENGFLPQFKQAQNNLTVNTAHGVSNSFANLGYAGDVALPIFDAAFGPRGTVPAIAAGSGYSSTTFIGYLQNGAVGSMANTLATNQNYVCRMFGSSFSPCTLSRIQPAATQQYNAPGAYPINFFMMNPFDAGQLQFVDNTGWSSYNGLQVQLRKQYYKGLTWQTNYSFSKSLSNSAADSANSGANFITLRDEKLDRRPSPFDIKHVIQTFGTYDLPFGRNKKFVVNNKVLDMIAGGWTASSVLVWSTGQPVQLGGNFATFNGTWTNGVQLAPGVSLSEISDLFHGQPLQKVNQTGNSNSLLNRAGATDLTRLAVPTSLIGPDGRANPQYLTVNTTPGTIGQVLYIYGKNNFSWDASLIKNFKFKERYRFELYAAATNVLNHPTWGMGSTSLYSTGFGTTGAPTGSRAMTFKGTVFF